MGGYEDYGGYGGYGGYGENADQGNDYHWRLICQTVVNDAIKPLCDMLPKDYSQDFEDNQDYASPQDYSQGQTRNQPQPHNKLAGGCKANEDCQSWCYPQDGVSGICLRGYCRCKGRSAQIM